MTGQKISHYEIGDELGSGGMGIVYKASDTELKRDVAIKFIRPEWATSPEIRKRFKREGQNAASLEHPNIVPIYDLIDIDDKLGLVMPYLPGQNLEEMIRADHPIPIYLATDIALQIARGLKAAHTHQKRIIHRDIKSNNIMIMNASGNTIVKIMDFGLAKAKVDADLTMTGIPLGTPPYMSPEQTLGKKLNHKTDIWSFGIVLYEMLTSQRPFKGRDAALYKAIQKGEYVSMTNLRPDILPELEEIVDRALEKQRAKRYRHIGDVLDILQEIWSDKLGGQVEARSIEKDPRFAAS